MILSTAQVSEEVNRKLPARNTMVQLLTLYTNHEYHNVVTDGQRWHHQPRADPTVCSTIG